MPSERSRGSWLDLILDEQKAKWKAGDRVRAEEYLARYPTLLDDSEAALDLIYQEFYLRRDSGESPTPDEYLERFPGFAQALVRQFAVDAAVGTADDDVDVSINGAKDGERKPNDAGQAGLAAPGVFIEGYEIARELGRGGMGVVYQARNIALGRPCALKMVLAAGHASREALDRFLIEARSFAELDHPNVLKIFHVGRHDGLVFLELEYADGGSLDGAIDGTPWEPRRAASLVESLARAVAEAHSRGIIHRDLKPANVLLSATGAPKIGDFGLAKLLNADSGFTRTDSVLGSPSYMAPEQAQGRSRLVGPQADVYSLGAILYELLTGRPPFRAQTVLETLHQVKTRDPVRLTALVQATPRDLETITLRCLEKDPHKRYPSARSLADDLKRFQEGRPIQARQPSRPERIVRWCKRNRWASAFLLTLGLGVIASGWQAIRATSAERAARSAETVARSERDRAQRARDRALESVQELLILNVGSDPIFLPDEMRATRKPLIDAGVRESRELVRELKGDPKAAIQLVEAYRTLAHIEIEARNPQKAIESARSSVAAAEQLNSREQSFDSARSLASALQLLSVALPDGQESRLAASRSSALFEMVLARWPEQNPEPSIREIVDNHINMGQRDSDQLRFREAIDHFRNAHDRWQKAIDQFGPVPSRLTLLATIELHECRALRRSRRFDESFRAGMRAESTFRSLWAAEPGQLMHGANLQLTYQELGFGYLDMAKPAEAIAEFNKARQTLRVLASQPRCQVSQVVLFKSLLAEVDYNVKVATDLDTVRFATTRREAIEEAYEIYEKLSFVRPTPLAVQRVYADGCFNKAVYQEHDGLEPDIGLLRKSEKIWDEFNRAVSGAAEARGYLVIVRRKLAEVLEARGQPQEAAHWRAISLSTARGDADLLFEIGLEYARMLAPVEELPLRLNASQRARLRKNLIDDTIVMLREAVAAGFKDVKRLRAEPLLTGIQSEAAYQALVAPPELPRDVFAPR